MREEVFDTNNFFYDEEYEGYEYILMKQSRKLKINLIKQDMESILIENTNIISMIEWMENKLCRMQLTKEFFMY